MCLNPGHQAPELILFIHNLHAALYFHTRGDYIRIFVEGMGWGGSWKVGRERERLEKKIQDTHWSHQRNDRK